MRKETKNSLVGLALLLTMTVLIVVMVKYSPQNSHSRSMTGRHIQNKNPLPPSEKLKLGMTKPEVKVAWGNHMNSKLKHNKNGTQEKWYYRCHLNTCRYVLTFENGILTQWEDN